MLLGLCAGRDHLSLRSAQNPGWHPSWPGFLDRGYPKMNRNVLYMIIGALAVAALVLGYQYYQEQQRTTGIQIDVGEGGVSIETK